MKNASLLLRIANAVLALAIVASLGALFLSSLACSAPTQPNTALDHDDSLAIKAIFLANRRPWPTETWRIERNSSGHATGLQLFGLSFDTIPADIRGLLDLERLDVSDNRLRSLPKELEALTSLIELNATRNKLTRLPDGLRLPHLDRLFLGQNQLTQLPTNVEVLNITTLVLDSNRIQSLPPDLKYLEYLNVLSVRNNFLDSLPADFGSDTHPYLKRLDVSGNNLVSLPAGITGFHLDYLDVGRNRICFPNPAQPDSSNGFMAQWLDSVDRDWRTSQQCP